MNNRSYISGQSAKERIFMEKECSAHSRKEHEALVTALRKTMPGEESFSLTAELFKAFSDVTRLRILTALLAGEICVCDIADTLEMTQSAISHQLRFLKNTRLIKSRRVGKTILYSLADSHVTAILALAGEHVAETLGR